MEKRFDILNIQKFEVNQLVLQIELEDSIKIDTLFWSKDSITPAIKIKEKNIKINGKNLTITLGEEKLEPFVSYYLISKSSGMSYRLFQENHAQFPRAKRYYDLGSLSNNSLHKILYLNDFGNIGLKAVPQIICDTYDRRLPINVELSALATQVSEIMSEYTIEWRNEHWKIDNKIKPFLIKLNSFSDDKLYATDYNLEFDGNSTKVKAKFNNLYQLQAGKDYAFGVEATVGHQNYTLLATCVSKELFEKFYPFYLGINLVPQDRISFKFTTNAAINLQREITMQEETTLPFLANDFEKPKYFTNMEKTQIKEMYKTLKNHGQISRHIVIFCVKGANKWQNILKWLPREI